MTSVEQTRPLDRAALPEPVLDAAPEFLELYWAAWQLAWAHVVSRDGMARSPYMDEGFDPETIWIWDTCFMAHFCKYAPAVFPGIESLDNFYRPMYDGAPLSIKIQHPDNPPLFAWTEEEYVRHTGDLGRVRRLLAAGYLQKHFTFFDEVRRGAEFGYSRIPTQLERIERGYRWNGVCSGMDNTPRASEQIEGGTTGPILWFDAAAQQALSARSIARLARLVGEDAIAGEYEAHHARCVDLVNDYWDDGDAIFYDRADTAPYAFHRVRTPAAYWPLLAGACSREQAAALAALLDAPACFGGAVPWPSVARDDPTFRSTGHYWRGGVWIPLAYMSARALADNGYPDIAAAASGALLRHLAATYREYEPASIWEAYAPDRPQPSTGKDDEYIVRADFCGWSALAPTSMLIEHVLGFRVDAVAHAVSWRRPSSPQRASPQRGRTGIRRLRCGAATVTMLDDGAGTISIETDAALTVFIDELRVDVHPGLRTLQVG